MQATLALRATFAFFLGAAFVLASCDPPKSSPGPSITTTRTKDGGTLAIYRDANGNETKRIETKADKSSITTTPKNGGTLAIYKDANGNETKRVVTMPRFTLTKNADKTYALAVADGVTSIAKGEFASRSERNIDGSIATALDTRLKRSLLGATKPDQAITTISLPSTLTGIGDYAFFGHAKVQGTLTIPAKVQSIGEKAFGYLGNLRTQAVSLVFEKNSNLTAIKAHAFLSASLTSFALPEQLETIEREAFGTLNPGSSKAIPSITIPANVRRISYEAFRRVAVTTLTIQSPDLKKTVSNIPLEDRLFAAFRSDSKITTLKLPKTVYDSYTKAELADRFGAVTNYQTLDGTAL